MLPTGIYFSVPHSEGASGGETADLGDQHFRVPSTQLGAGPPRGRCPSGLEGAAGRFAVWFESHPAASLKKPLRWCGVRGIFGHSEGLFKCHSSYMSGEARFSSRVLT